MPLTHKLVCLTVPNLGVLVVLLHVSPELEVVVPTEVVKLLLVTCVERVECLPPSRHGEGGTEVSI